MIQKQSCRKMRRDCFFHYVEFIETKYTIYTKSNRLLMPNMTKMAVDADGSNCYNGAIRKGIANDNSHSKKGTFMTKVIDIKNEEQVKKINRLACEAPYEVWLSTDAVMLDARSLLGLFALVGKRTYVVAEDNVDPRSFSKLVDKMA